MRLQCSVRHCLSLGGPARPRTPTRRRGCAPQGAREDNLREAVGEAEAVDAIKAPCGTEDSTTACEASWELGRVAQPRRGESNNNNNNNNNNNKCCII